MNNLSTRLYTDLPNIDEFKKLCSQTTNAADYPLSQSISQNVPIYDLSSFTPSDSTTTTRLQDEWYHILSTGPGVFILKNMYPHPTYNTTLETTTRVFESIITHERATSGNTGDHFAAGGKNDRIWNSFSKHGLHDPTSFVAYYSNPWLALVSEAWLGPTYRVTAQVNVVKPGGAAQDPHRDYHLGFQTQEDAARFPRGMHLASQFLTLQGAIAHSEMPVESGPTRFLPFSQCFEQGYLAWRESGFREFFGEKYISLPLGTGDGVFFNPALFHAAGANEMSAESGFRRIANLLQVSSGMGKAMEGVDAVPLVERCWDVLGEMYRRKGLDEEVRAFVGAVADGYPFPTNLDHRPPQPSGMAPEGEREIMVRGLAEGWTKERVVEELMRMRRDSLP